MNTRPENMTAQKRDELIEAIKQKAIEMGLRSIKTEKTLMARRGGVKGFNMCKPLRSREAFEQLLKERKYEEDGLREKIDLADLVKERERLVDAYWESRWATVQIEWIYDILRVVWDSNCSSVKEHSVSARVVMVLRQIIKALRYEKKET